MKKVLLLLSSVIILLVACDSGPGPEADQPQLRPAKGDRFYGGTLNLTEPEYFSLYPPSIIYAVPFRIASQVFETLVTLDPENMTIVPGIAASWSVDEATHTVYTFKLKKGVLFHDDPCFPESKGRAVTAKDVKACLEKLCKFSQYDAGYKYMLKDRVVGANAYYEASKMGTNGQGLEGVKVIDDHTLEITLVEPYTNFLFALSMPYTYVYPQEAYDKYGEEVMVGTGPFQVDKVVKEKEIVLKRNPHYHRMDEFGNQLPFLDGVVIEFTDDKDAEVERFKAGDLDLIHNLSTQHIIDIIEIRYDEGQTEKIGYQNQRQPSMSTFTYEFLNQGSVFSNKDLRKAFSYAIDRNLILQKILDGEAFGPGIHGFTPPVIEGYDVTQIKGYTFDPSKAKEHLKKAGYKDGADLKGIAIDVNKMGGRNERIANEIIRQLKANLNVDVTLNLLTQKEKLDRMKAGKSVMYNREWSADFPNPENFLSLLYGRDVPADMSEESYPNTARYANPAFDELFEKGVRASNLEASYGFFLEAEKIAMDDAPFIILVYPESYRILQPYVRNLPDNPMQFRDYAPVWFDQKEWQKAQERKQDPVNATANEQSE